MEAKSIEEIVKLIRGAIGIADDKEWLVFNALGLVSEAGETANIVKKIAYYAPSHGVDGLQVIDELCDTLFHIVALCTAMGIEFEELQRVCVEKHRKNLKRILSERLHG